MFNIASEETISLNTRPEKKFDSKEIKFLLRGIVNAHLTGKNYNHIMAYDWMKTLTRQIHDKLKEVGPERYKFAVQVIVGENRGQGFKAICGGLWDEETDGAVTVLYTGETVYCVAAVFLIYGVCYD